MPMYKNSALTVTYEPIANTSHVSGDRKFGHSPRWLGYGRTKKKYQERPTWMIGYSPAVRIAITVMPSADRPIAARRGDRVKYRIADTSVPEWLTPMKNTNVVISDPHMTGELRPVTPRP